MATSLHFLVQGCSTPRPVVPRVALCRGPASLQRRRCWPPGLHHWPGGHRPRRETGYLAFDADTDCQHRGSNCRGQLNIPLSCKSPPCLVVSTVCRCADSGLVLTVSPGWSPLLNRKPNPGLPLHACFVEQSSTPSVAEATSIPGYERSGDRTGRHLLVAHPLQYLMSPSALALAFPSSHSPGNHHLTGPAPTCSPAGGELDFRRKSPSGRRPPPPSRTKQ